MSIAGLNAGCAGATPAEEQSSDAIQNQEQGAYATARDYAQAERLVGGGQHAQAHDVLKTLMKRNPDHIEGRILQGVVDAHQGRIEKARTTFEALTREYPQRAEPHNNLAVIHVVEGNLEKARELLVNKLRKIPDPSSYENLASIYDKLATQAREQAESITGAKHESPQPAPAANTAAPGNAVNEEPITRGTNIEEGETIPWVLMTDTSMETKRTPASATRNGLERTRSEPMLGADTPCEGKDKQTRHTVHLGPVDSRSEAYARTKALRETGIEDIAVINHGELRNAVSLGVYQEAGNAARRTEEVRAMGHDASVYTHTECAKGAPGTSAS